MSRKVAVVGSRSGVDPFLVRDFIASLSPGTIVVSGGAKGVDELARVYAERYNLICIEVHPAWGTGKGAGFARNSIIVELADEVVAFWDGQSRGTMDTVTKARQAGKPVDLRNCRRGERQDSEDSGGLR